MSGKNVRWISLVLSLCLILSLLPAGALAAEAVCTCGAAADADGVIVHTEGCPLYEAPAGEEPPGEDGCTCGAQADTDGAVVHTEGCPLYEAPAGEEPVSDVPGIRPLGEPALLTTTAEHGTHSSWTPLSGTITQNSFYGGGRYWLSGDVTYSGAGNSLTIQQDVTLCLNGHTLDMGSYTTLTVSSGATLTICDCGSGGTITGGESYSGFNVISVEGGTLNLESGTISGTTTGSGSLISVTGGTLNVTGGTISLNHTGTGAYSGVQAVKLSNSTVSFTGGKVSLTTVVDDNYRATTVYQEGGSVTVGDNATLSFQSEKGLYAPGHGALCVTQNGSVTVEDNCTITASRTGGEMAGAVSIGKMISANNYDVGTATITGGDINGFLVVYGEATIYNGSFAYIENRGTLTMTGGTVKNENENGINYGIWTSVTNGKTDLSNVSITAATGIYVNTGLRPTIGDGVTINATEYGVDGSATLVGAPSISGGIADLYIYSMRTTTDYPSVDAMAYTGGALTVQERKFPDAHQGGYIGCAIEVPEDKANLFSLTNSDGNFVYRYDTENSALRLYNTKSHPICGASCGHEDASHNDPAWQKWSTPSGYTLTGGSYYLTGPVTLSQPITITGDVNLCLNGNTIKRSDGSSIPFQVESGGSLTICDCQTTGQLTGGIAANGGHISIYGGTISGGAYAVDLGGNAKLTLAGSPDLSGTTAALKLYTKSDTALDNAAVDATGYTGSTLEVEENDVPGGANGFAIQGGENKFSLTNPSGGYHYAYEGGGYVIRPDHTHSYTYSGSGSIITEKCDCGHSATATISIRAGADLTYTGSAITPAEVTYSDTWQGGKDLSIAYSNNINAGDATAKIEKDNAAASVTFTIGKANQAPPTAGDYTIDYINEKITGIAGGCKVYTAQDAATEITGNSSISGYLGSSLYIRKEATDNYYASDWTTITLASHPAAPTVTPEPESIKGKGDGKVTDVDTTMEYSTDGGQSWTACTGTEITGLAANTTVAVRVKATGAAPHGLAASCAIPEGTKTLTVTFNSNGGSAVDQKTGLSYNATITAPANPTKTGYTFDGWYKEAACTNQWNFSSDKVTENITLYAKWTANTDTPYTVKHWQQNLNGGSEQTDTNYTLTDTENLTGTTGASVTPSVKSYDGFTAPSATTVTIAADGSTVVNYYYTRNSYTVTLEKGTGIASVSGGGTYQYGASVTIRAEVSDGYEWSKWSDSNTDQEHTFTMGADDITLTAQAAPVTYAITYDLGGGAVSGNPETYTVESADITLNNPTRTGYTFAGWTGTGLTGASDTVTIVTGSTGDRTYTAAWTANTYTITYEGMDGAQHGENPPAAHTYGTDTPVPNPVKAGYTFVGWLVNGAGDGVKDLTLRGTDYTADITLTAQWTLEVPTVELTADKNQVTYGGTITLTAAASHSGGTLTYEWRKDGSLLADETGRTLTLTDVADSGSYTVRVTATGGGGQQTTAEDSLAVSIAPAPVTPPSQSGAKFTYNGQMQTYPIAGNELYTVAGSRQTDAGTYTVTVSLTDKDNYTWTGGGTEDRTYSFTIAPKAITATWSGLTQVYGDGTQVQASLSGVVGGDAVAVSIAGTGQTAGSHSLTAALTGADAANYALKNAAETLTIRPKAVGFTVSGNAVEGDGTPKTATLTPTDSALAESGYTVTYRQGTATAAAPAAVGSYKIWVAITDGNYRHTNGKADMQVGTLTITQAPPVLYDVTFAGGEGAAGTAPDGLSAVAGAKIILPENAFTRETYQFTGWSDGGKTYQPGDSFSMPARDVTFTAQWQPTYGITVTVREPKPDDSGEMQPVSGAVVSLWLGANKLDEQTTDSDGKYTFADLLPGIYNLVVTKDERTVTTMVEITTEDVAKTADLPRGATNSIVKVTEGSPDIVVGNLENMFTEEPPETADGNYDAGDAAVVEGGGKVEITFIAEDKTESTDQTTQDEVNAIKAQAGASVTLGLVMDYSVQKDVYLSNGQKDEDKSTAITQTRALLEIRLPLPAELWDMASYTVYRYHGTAAEKMTENPGENQEGFTVDAASHVITIYAQKFSTYAIGYTESDGNHNHNNNQTSGGGGGGTPTPVYPPSIEEPEHGTVTISPKNPQKGDKVTISPTPEEGYAVDEVIITGPGGEPPEVTPNDDGTYTFVQPSGKVTITVTFRPISAPSGCPRDERCPMAPFSDADRNAWYHDGVHYCLETGLMVGIDAHTFVPDAPTTRGMLVTILWRLEGSPIVGGPMDYNDVKAEDWYGGAVRWADSTGVVTGYDNGAFGPNDTITREQMAVMLWRYLGSPAAEGSLSSFVDGAQTSDWAQSAMIWAVDQGVLTGVGNDRLEPGGQATRAQAATMLLRFADKVAQ